MEKITCCGDAFAALSSHGEVYIFSPSANSTNSIPASSSSVNVSTSANDSEASSRTGGPFKCQRVWALRKKFSAVKDVALGVDGSIIVCTESGHVYVRTRTVKLSSVGGSASSGSQKAFKFVKVPGLQRVTRVCASASGAFGALRVEFGMKDIEVKGNFVGQDLTRVRPWVEFGKDDVTQDMRTMEPDEGLDKRQTVISSLGYGLDSDNEDIEMGGEDDAILNDIRLLREMCDVIKREDQRKRDGRRLEEMHLPHGADSFVVLNTSNIAFPVHRAILGARSKILRRILLAKTKKMSSVLDDQRNIKISMLPPLQRRPANTSLTSGPGSNQVTQLSITSVHPLSILILLHYLYSDNLVAIWDRRVSNSIIASYARGLKIKMDPGLIKTELQVIGRMLELVEMLKVLERPVKSDVGQTLVRDMRRLFDVNLEKDHENDNGEGGQGKVTSGVLRGDVILELADREVFTHSVILRSRSNLFKSFFDEPVWTVNRWEKESSEGVEEGEFVRIHLKHLKWRAMEFVLKFMCCGCDKELFERLEFVSSVDDLVEFMFEVMAAAVCSLSDSRIQYSNQAR
jgi:hypothetical protein